MVRIKRFTLARETEILDKALSTWGAPAQVGQLVEELGELLAAVNRFNRGRVLGAGVAEEIADVRIMLRQLERLLNIEETVAKFRNTKLSRLESRLKKEESDGERVEEGAVREGRSADSTPA